jgi:quercetin dioxygenase-like cupin family protein
MNFHKIKLIAAALLIVAITGCSTTSGETETPVKPADITVAPRGLKIIEKNVEALAPMPNTTTSGAGCYELFSSLNDDIKPDCSVLFIRVQPGEELIKHSISSDMIIYVISGGGNITIDKHAYIMSSGEAIYIPAGKPRHVLNNSKKTLEFLMYISPANQQENITLLQEKKPERKDKQKIIAQQNKIIAKKVLGKDAQNIGNETIKNVQELTPKEGKVPSTPPDTNLQ